MIILTKKERQAYNRVLAMVLAIGFVVGRVSAATIPETSDVLEEAQISSESAIAIPTSSATTPAVTTTPDANQKNPKKIEKDKQDDADGEKQEKLTIKTSVEAIRNLNMYKKPDRDSKVMDKVMKGANLLIFDEDNGWLQVMTDGKTAYVNYLDTNYFEKVKFHDTYGVLTGDYVNFRENPGMKGKVQSILTKDTGFELLSYKKLSYDSEYGWYKVKVLSTGKTGYIYGRYIKEVSKSKAEKKENTQEEKKQITTTSTKTKTQSKKGSTTLKYSESYNVTSNKLTAKKGTVNYNGHKETYYSQKVLPGGGLNIPGRHVAEDGTIRDKDGYICVASDLSYMSKGSTLMTSLGPAKVYDTGCDYKTIDVYVNW